MLNAEYASLFNNQYRIPTTRLQGWDYGNNGAYYVTIVTQNRKPFFGSISPDGVIRSSIGELAQTLLDQISVQFPFVTVDASVVMPDHIHLLLRLDKTTADFEKEAPLEVRTPGKPMQGSHNPMRRNDLPRVVRWFKGRCTFEFRQTCPEFAWLAGYHDRVIRNEKEYIAFMAYTHDNPKKAWQQLQDQREKE
jgi:putative transposase